MNETDRELLQRLSDENTRLRAALALSDRPCAYCSLPADKWSECQHGLPGCDRADDAMGCPHLGAAIELERLRMGEFICQRCGIRKDSEHEITHDF